MISKYLREVIYLEFRVYSAKDNFVSRVIVSSYRIHVYPILKDWLVRSMCAFPQEVHEGLNGFCDKTSKSFSLCFFSSLSSLLFLNLSNFNACNYHLVKLFIGTLFYLNKLMF